MEFVHSKFHLQNPDIYLSQIQIESTQDYTKMKPLCPHNKIVHLQLSLLMYCNSLGHFQYSEIHRLLYGKNVNIICEIYKKETYTLMHIVLLVYVHLFSKTDAIIFLI